MTDKELKKLSRLELLELLLTESRENERLKEELEKIKQENTVEKSAQHLNETSDKLETALQQMSSLITQLGEVRDRECVVISQTVAAEPTVAEKIVEKSVISNDELESNDSYTDFRIYKSLIVFFISNPESLEIFPEELRQTVINRIEAIKSK